MTSKSLRTCFAQSCVSSIDMCSALLRCFLLRCWKLFDVYTRLREVTSRSNIIDTLYALLRVLHSEGLESLEGVSQSAICFRHPHVDLGGCLGDVGHSPGLVDRSRLCLPL